MKRKHILLSAALLSTTLFSCSKGFLDVSPKGQFSESDYYQNADQVFNALVAVYNPLGWQTGGTDNTYIQKVATMAIASDEAWAGGGSSSDVPGWQALNTYSMTTALGPQSGMWSRNYTGIYRANVFLSKVDIADSILNLSSDLKKRYIAETKFLRAYYYFDLVREFKNIPLITAPVELVDAFNQKQVSPDSVYAFIESDLKAALPILPATVSANENGRITQGAANALLGKVILTENNTSRMSEAAKYLNTVNTSGNYELLENYGDIFNPKNKFNKESILEIVHSSEQQATWDTWNQFMANVFSTMIGPRSYSGPTYWGGGYGFCPVTLNLVDAMKGDPRYKYTIVNIDSIVKANAATKASYQASQDGTGYYIAKYAPLAANAVASYPELNWGQDEIEIRLADTYLMEAEALVRGGGDQGRAKTLLDAVRARVGLPSVPATLDNIYNERRLELATEGHRWFDLVRTGKAAQALAFKQFKAGVNEVFPIPLQSLNNTTLVQNSGYN